MVPTIFLFMKPLVTFDSKMFVCPKKIIAVDFTIIFERNLGLTHKSTGFIDLFLNYS